MTSVLLACMSATAKLPQNIQEQIGAIEGLGDSQVSMWVKPIDGSPIINHHADTPRVPASTQKLVTTFASLQTLGADYHWHTRLYTRGWVAGSVLYGDLIIKGSGDPSLTHERLTAMLGQLAHKGIRHIKGDIIVDNTAFSGVKYNINAFDGQGQRAYNAQPNALLINFGTVQVDLTPSGREVWTDQTTKQGKPISRFVATGDEVAVKVSPRLADFDYPAVLRGTQGACREPKFQLSATTLSISQPTTTCGQSSHWLSVADGDELVKKAILGTWQSLDPDFDGQIRLEQTHVYGLPIVSYPSRPLSAQIYDINQYSNNVMTEQVALSLPLAHGETVSDYPKTFGFLQSWWQNNFKSTAPVMTRASGLCRDCKITPHAMGEMLEFAYHQPDFEVFKASLPIAGQTGTMALLANRNPEHPAIGRAFIKTGTLSDVVAMAGYIQDSQDRWYVAVGMINAPNSAYNGAIKVLDEMLATVATY